jgi:hypothetical protein
MPLHEWRYDEKDCPKIVTDEFGFKSKDRPPPARACILRRYLTVYFVCFTHLGGCLPRRLQIGASGDFLFKSQVFCPAQRKNRIFTKIFLAWKLKN